MKKILTLILLTAIYYSSNAQLANKKIADCLNKSDFFTLSEIYPLLHDSVNPFLQDISESLLNTYFNKPQEAVVSFERFFDAHQDKISPQMATGMIYLWAENLKQKGEYKKVIQLIDDYLLNYNKDEIAKLKPTFQALLAYSKAYSSFPKSEIIKPEKDIRVPLFFRNARKKGYKIVYIPVTINGKTHDFIFDTGAGDNVITEKFAKENQITILNDSIPMQGIKSGYGKLGFAAKITIGELTYTNLSFLVVPNIIHESVKDKVQKLDAVLGLPFIRKLTEFQIFPNKNEILFPHKESITENIQKNLILNNSTLLLNLEYDQTKLAIQFDSGDMASSLNEIYYKQHKKTVEQKGIKDTICIGGFGGVDTLLCYRMPSLTFSIGKSQFDMIELDVITEQQLSTNNQKQGVFGVNFITQFDKITVNLKQMRMEVFSNQKLDLSDQLNLPQMNIDKKAHRKLHYDTFNPSKTAWESTAKKELSKSAEKQKRQFDVTQKTSPKW